MMAPGKIAVLLSLAFLAGCASQAAAPVQGPIQPVVGDVFHLDVAQIEIFRPAAEPGTVIDMSTAVENWLRKHLVAVGTSGRIRAGINNAAVRESVMRRTAPGGTSFNRVRQYDGMVHVRIDATNRSTGQAGFAGGSASRSQTVAADIQVAQQHQVASDMADALMRDFSYSLSADVRQRLAKFLR